MVDTISSDLSAAPKISHIKYSIRKNSKILHPDAGLYPVTKPSPMHITSPCHVYHVTNSYSKTYHGLEDIYVSRVYACTKQTSNYISRVISKQVDTGRPHEIFSETQYLMIHVPSTLNCHSFPEETTLHQCGITL